MTKEPASVFLLALTLSFLYFMCAKRIFLPRNNSVVVPVGCTECCREGARVNFIEKTYGGMIDVDGIYSGIIRE